MSGFINFVKSLSHSRHEFVATERLPWRACPSVASIFDDQQLLDPGQNYVSSLLFSLAVNLLLQDSFLGELVEEFSMQMAATEATHAQAQVAAATALQVSKDQYIRLNADFDNFRRRTVSTFSRLVCLTVRRSVSVQNSVCVSSCGSRLCGAEQCL